jgi:hypothetical protein
VSVTGSTLTIYASVPTGTPDAGGIVDAEKLALQQGGAQVGKFALKLRFLTAAKVSDNARTAIENSSTVAYIGELAPEASAGSIGITNAQDVLQVSPVETALPPDAYYESRSTYGATFARAVSTTTTQEATAQVAGMAALKIKSVLIANDGSAYGSAIAAAVRAHVGTTAIKLAASAAQADGAFYGTAYAAAASREFAQWSGANRRIKLLAPAIATVGLSTSASQLYTAADDKAVAALTSAAGSPPAPAAVLAYDAVAQVVRAIHQAGSAANDRSTVVRAFFATRDTSLPTFGLYQLRAGKLVPLKR